VPVVGDELVGGDGERVREGGDGERVREGGGGERLDDGGGSLVGDGKSDISGGAVVDAVVEWLALLV
tara:strand:- start:2622 stop:2822 length:201 start_codon:yes stop_codon:yes gene_type:complete